MKSARVILILLCLIMIAAQVGFAQQDPSQTAEPDKPAAFIQATDRSKVVPGQYIVVFKKTAGLPLTSQQNIESFAAGYGIVPDHVYTKLLIGFSAKFGDDVLRALLRDPNIEYIEEDSVVEAYEVGSWGLDRIDQRQLPLNELYDWRNGGAGVTAYIVDSGIRSTHQEFTGRILSGYTTVHDGKGTDDCNGHGTHVAGTVGGSLYGVAKYVNLVPVRVLNCAGQARTSLVVDGLDWVADHKNLPAVVNLSLGGPTSISLDTAVKFLIDLGVSVVAAAGNEDANACIFSPARVAAALTVAASDLWDSRASYSNRGSCVDLFAPGSYIISAGIASDTASETKSGTSMAAPHIAGIAATILSSNPTFTPSQVTALILNNATAGVISDPKGSPNRLAFSNFSFEPPLDPKDIMAVITPLLLGDTPIVTIQASDATASESGADTGTFTVTRTRATTDALTVNYTVSGTAAPDYDYNKLSGTVVIPAGSASATITVTPIDDSISEFAETVIATLSASSTYGLGSPSSATIQIIDNEKPQVSVKASDAQASEAGPDRGAFKFKRTGDTSENVVVKYSVSGTARAGEDYKALSGTVTIPAGKPEISLKVVPVDDKVVEPSETVIMKLIEDAAYMIGTPKSAKVTIADND